MLSRTRKFGKKTICFPNYPVFPSEHLSSPFHEGDDKWTLFMSKPTHARPIVVISHTCSPFCGIIPYKQLQYWPIYYGFFFGKKVKNLNISKTERHFQKKFSVIVRETNEEENAKIAPFIFENYGRR